ncbi:MAG TPA: hypothetical protein VML55_01130 [Planctomycetaceae bacterium]|nr:hypothetical protein [Planctomycetaceae bacterium]
MYEASTDRAFWLYVQSCVEQQQLDEDSHDRVTVHLPTANRLNRTAVRRFRRFRDNVLAQVKGVIRHDVQ